MMRVFISWSGDISHQIAVRLRDWLPVVLPYAEPWVSSEDIPRGSRWGIELSRELESTAVGILCLVPGNTEEPWLVFEAGALSKSVGSSQVHPLLFGIAPADLKGPLSQFQASPYSKDDLLKLLKAINSFDSKVALRLDELQRNFEICWPDIEKKLEPILGRLKGSEGNRDKREGSEKSIAQTKRLKELDISILEIVLDAPEDGISVDEIAKRVNIHKERAKHSVEKLRSMSLLDAEFNMFDGTLYRLSQGGRAVLFEGPEAD